MKRAVKPSIRGMLPSEGEDLSPTLIDVINLLVAVPLLLFQLAHHCAVHGGDTNTP